jgi:hypothetical protein
MAQHKLPLAKRMENKDTAIAAMKAFVNNFYRKKGEKAPFAAQGKREADDVEHAQVLRPRWHRFAA